MHIRFILSFILIFLYGITTHAQQQVAKPEEHNFRLAPYFNLPQESLMLTDDTASTILVNPARAVIFKENFFYLTYFGISGNNLSPSTISVNTLFNAAGSKWLFSLFTNRTNSETIQETHEPFYSPEKYSQRVLQENIKVKLSNICNNPTNHSSIGVIFSYNQSKNNSTRATSRNYLEDVDYSISEDENELGTYLCGIEYTYFNSHIDLIMDVHYQKANNNYRYSYQYFKSIIDTNNFEQITQVRNTNTIDFNPSTLGFGASAFIRSNLLFDDEYFSLTLSSYYSEKNRNAKFNMYSLYNSEIDSTHIETSLAKDFDEKEVTKGIKFNAGYNFSYRLSYITLYGGMLASMIHDKFTIPEINSYTTTYRKIDYSLLTCMISIPIMLEYMPADFCQIYGGLTYNYSYEQYKWDINSRVVESTNLTDMDESRKIENIISETNFCAGLNLTHPEGIRLCCFANSNFSDFSGWTISIGYLF
ncbi:MAG: hypothetical protein V1720_22385 [bacterium]